MKNWLQREAAKEADAVYREALADGMTPEEILQTVKFEFLHIHDHTTELTGTEAEEESTALALQSEIDGAKSRMLTISPTNQESSKATCSLSNPSE